MWLMLQQETPEDFVVATGEAHSVKEFVEKAFAHVGRSIEWRGSGVEETGHDKTSGQLLVRVNPKYFRPTEVVSLIFWQRSSLKSTLITVLQKLI